MFAAQEIRDEASSEEEAGVGLIWVAKSYRFNRTFFLSSFAVLAEFVSIA